MRNSISLLVILIGASLGAGAHPTGNMVVAGEYVLWPYVDPVNDPDHHACVMAWKPGSDPEVLLRSEHAGSDFMLYAVDETIWLIERRNRNDQFEIRLLRMEVGKTHEIIWDWRVDERRIGEGGFFVDDDGSVIFGAYPGIFRLANGSTPEKYFNFDHPIRRIRRLSGDTLLLLGESTAWLTDKQGRILREWSNLTDPDAPDAPLSRNMLFDIDYREGQLLTAYWGQRRFDLVKRDGSIETVYELEDPLVPHWVAYYKDNVMLFASEIVFDGRNPAPCLSIREQAGISNIWCPD